MRILILAILVVIVAFYIAGRIFGYFGASAYLDKLKPSFGDIFKSSFSGVIYGGVFIFLESIVSYQAFEGSNLVIKIIMVILAILSFLLGWLRRFNKNKDFFKEERLKNVWP